MAAGFGHPDARSRYGRRIKPTSKVKELLANSMLKIYDSTARSLDILSTRLQGYMRRNIANTDLIPVVDEWLDMYDELMAAEEEYRCQISGRELMEHDARYNQKVDFYTHMQTQIGQFIDNRKRLGTQARATVNIQEVEDESRSIEDEISVLEEELSRFDFPNNLPTSTPKVEVKEEPARENTTIHTDQFTEREEPYLSSWEWPIINVPPYLPPIPNNQGTWKNEEQEPDLTQVPLGKHDQQIPKRVRRLAKPVTTAPVVNLPPAEVPQPVVLNLPPLVTAAAPQPHVPPDPGGKEPTMIPEEDKTLSILNKLVDVLSKKDEKGKLPDREPNIFTGNVLEFPLWWNSFETLVEKKTSTSSERIFYLDKYTSGEAKKSISGFLNLFQDENAYSRARSTLIARYGNKRKTAEAFREKLEKQGNLKKYDAKGLQEYADLLWQCHAAMQSINYLAHLETPEENIKMAGKLPVNLMERWNSYVDKYMYEDLPDNTKDVMDEENPYPPFLDFCRFVAGEARKAAGPCAPKVQPERAERREPRRNVSLSTNANTQERKPEVCLYCKKTHPLYKCTAFLVNSSDYKKTYARENALCFGCLRRNHIYRTCRIRNSTLMKDGLYVPKEEASTASTSTLGNEDFFSSIIPITLEHPSDPRLNVAVYAVLDTQSDSCYIREDIVEEMKLSCKPIQLEITTMNSVSIEPSNVVFGLKACGAMENTSINLPKCYTKSFIPGNVSTIPTPENVRKWDHLKGVADELLPLDESRRVGILIGYNCPAAMFWKKMYEDGPDKPYGMKTELGWCVMGNVEKSNTESNQEEAERKTSVCSITSHREVGVTTKDIKRAFDLEFEESRSDQLKKMSVDDYQFIASAEKSVNQKSDKHFELNLPFKEDPENLPDNRPMAFSKLMYLKKKLIKDQVMSQRYRDFIQKMIDKGHAELVTNAGKAGRVWYWSHHGVYHPHKLDKLRVVFNGSEIFRGISLNQLLLIGPELINQLVGVLCRFRVDKYAFTCDVEGMFHQVGVTEDYRDYLRFLWFKDGDPTKEIVEYRMKVHLFGASSSPGCANYAFRHVADVYEEQYGKEVADFIRRNFYVDDGLKCLLTIQRLVDMMLRSHEMCLEGGFNLCKYMSNSEEAMRQIPDNLRAKQLEFFEIKEPNAAIERTLGMLWQLLKDVFMFLVKKGKVAETRREMLSSVSSIYDPLGMIGPVILVGRQILQEVCVDKLTWDEKVPPQIQESWNSWYAELDNLQKIEIPRCVRSTTEDIKSVQLIHFSDASIIGYGTVSYIKVTDVNDNVDINMLYAKSKVKPNKQVTVPRLELQAAVLASKIAIYLTQELDFENIVNSFYTDSKVVLGYLYNHSKKFQIYVANRIHTILSNSEKEDWHFVDGKVNPADLASRGCSATSLAGNVCWWKGPSFLHEKENPERKQENYELSEEDPELKKEKTRNLASESKPKEEDFFMTSLLKLPSWYRIKRAVAYWKRFVNAVRSKIAGKKVQYQKDLPDVAEMSNAEQALFCKIQDDRFGSLKVSMKEMTSYPMNKAEIKKRKGITKRISNLYKLDLYKDEDDLLRVGGRLRRASIPVEIVHPVLLPKDHPMVIMLVRHYHLLTQHSGRCQTLNAVRQAGIWITQARSCVYTYIKDCVICNMLRKKPQVQKMSDLPEERLTEDPPFTHVGVDVFGPFIIKIGCTLKKRWVVIFTCLTIRAVHVEILHSMSTDSYINAYRRFIHRRGPCRTIHCDCGSNFIGAKGELDAALAKWDVHKIQTFCLKDNCDFVEYRFNFPKSSHMGGVWERMIRSVRGALAYLLSIHGESLNDEMLHTLLTEAEAIVNARPLTYVDTRDPYLPPMTPSQLLTLKSSVVMPPPGEFIREDLYCRKRWRKVQYLATQFWYRWRNEYVHQLQSRSKWQHESENLKKGDVVLLVDENAPRNKWEKGLIDEVYPGKDGKVRKVTIKTAKTYLDRPIHKTVLLYRPETKDSQSGEPQQ